MVYDLSCIVYYMFNSTAENSVSHSKEVFMALHWTARPHWKLQGKKNWPIRTHQLLVLIRHDVHCHVRAMNWRKVWVLMVFQMHPLVAINSPTCTSVVKSDSYIACVQSLNPWRIIPTMGMLVNSCGPLSFLLLSFCYVAHNESKHGNREKVHYQFQWNKTHQSEFIKIIMFCLAYIYNPWARGQTDGHEDISGVLDRPM